MEQWQLELYRSDGSAAEQEMGNVLASCYECGRNFNREMVIFFPFSGPILHLHSSPLFVMFASGCTTGGVYIKASFFFDGFHEFKFPCFFLRAGGMSFSTMNRTVSIIFLACDGHTLAMVSGVVECMPATPYDANIRFDGGAFCISTVEREASGEGASI